MNKADQFDTSNPELPIASPIGGTWTDEPDPTVPYKVELPREGYELFFKEEGHVWQRVNPKGKPGVRYPGASTVAQAFPDRPDPLMYWTESKALEGVARLVQAGVFVPSDPFALRTVLEQHGLRWPQIRDEAAARGTNIHVTMLEALARGEEIPDLEVLPKDQRGYGQAVFKWWQKRKPEPLNVEQPVLSLDRGYCGRFDLRCKVTNGLMDPCQGVGIVDLKTGKHVYRADHIQLRLYDIAARECGIGEQDWLMALHVKPDGTFEEHFCCATEEHAMLALHSYEAAKVVDKAMRNGAK